MIDYSIVRTHAEVLNQLGVPLWLAVQLLACTNSRLKAEIKTVDNINVIALKCNGETTTTFFKQSKEV